MAKYHPDKNKGNEKEAEQKFCDIDTCFEMIKFYRKKYEKWEDADELDTSESEGEEEQKV